MEAFNVVSAKENSSSNAGSHSGGTAEISVIIKNLKDAGVIVSITCSFKYSIWTVKKTDGSRRIIDDYQKLNEEHTSWHMVCSS